MTALTRNQQLRGQRQLLFAALLNPLGAGIVMGPVISLLALHYGASDFHMGLIYASLYLCSLSALLPPLFLNKYDYSKILGFAWLLRALIGGGFLYLPFIESVPSKIITLIVLLYCFSLTRAIGASTAPPVLKALNRQNELTSYTASIWGRWHLGILGTTILSYIVLQNKDAFPSEEIAYISLLAFAFVFNLLTAFLYLRLPNTGSHDSGGVVALARAIRYISRRRENMDVIIVGFLQVALAISAAYQLSHIQGPLAFSPGHVFALTLAGVIGAYLTAKLVSLLGDRVSFRSLLFLTHLLLAICGASWICINQFSADTQSSLAAVLYIISTTMLALSATVWAAMSTSRLPKELRLEVSTLYLLNTTIAAAASLGLIALLRWLLAGQLDNPYIFAYIPWTILSVCICVWAILRKDDGDPDILNELQQLKPSNIQSIYIMQRVGKSDVRHSRHRVRQIENALMTDTPASRESLLNFLSSSHVSERLAAYYSLMERSYSKAYPLVIKEVLDPYSPIRGEAITALGLSNDAQHIPILEGLLTDSNPRLVSTVIKSLLRLNAPMDAELIYTHYFNNNDYRQRLEISIGLSENKRLDCLRHILTEEGKAQADTRWLISIALQWTDAIDKQLRFGSILQLEEDNEGIEDVLRECASAFDAIWQQRLDDWLAHHDCRTWINQHPDIERWPVRNNIDLIIQILMAVWTDAYLAKGSQTETNNA